MVSATIMATSPNEINSTGSHSNCSHSVVGIHSSRKRSMAAAECSSMPVGRSRAACGEDHEPATTSLVAATSAHWLVIVVIICLIEINPMRVADGP